MTPTSASPLAWSPSPRPVLRFDAIPYARAPIGDQRFLAPSIVPWSGSGPRATRPGPIAPQRRSRLADGMGEFERPQAEDCLQLTLWTPAADAARRPVVLWLHGGAWMTGAGALDWYDGSRLAGRGDLVVVAPNFRLGPLGWLPFPGGATNAGLLDQSLAIDWVVRHIDQFGGDPEQITLMGQSAGAMSVAQLIAAEPAAKPRFQRAILQSPGLGRGFRPAAVAADLGRQLMQIAGTADLAALQALPIDALQTAASDPALMAAVRVDHPDRGLAYPVADAEVGFDPGQIPGPAVATLPVMIGWNHDEYTIFPGYGPDARAAAQGDAVYGVWSRAWAQAAVARSGRAWLYRFDHGPNPRFGACHCAELPFVFDSLEAFRQAPMLAGGDTAHMADLSRQVQTAWIRFIRTGSPGWAPGPHPQVFA